MGVGVRRARKEGGGGSWPCGEAAAAAAARSAQLGRAVGRPPSAAAATLNDHGRRQVVGQISEGDDRSQSPGCRSLMVHCRRADPAPLSRSRSPGPTAPRTPSASAPLPPCSSTSRIRQRCDSWDPHRYALAKTTCRCSYPPGPSADALLGQVPGDRRQADAQDHGRRARQFSYPPATPSVG